MNEEQFNMDLRKFLKQFGVNAQREVERVVQRGLETGALSGRTTLKVRARLEIEESESALVIEEDLRIS